MGGSGAAGGRGGGANADPVSRQLGMTLDEAANILNVKKPSEAFKDSELQQMLKVRPPLSPLYSPFLNVWACELMRVRCGVEFRSFVSSK